jgi:excisionase family DNA binding protein
MKNTTSAAVMTIKELEAYLKISTSAAYKLVHSDGFPAIKIGDCIRIHKDGLDKWLVAQYQ